jgi:hypothetical protein
MKQFSVSCPYCYNEICQLKKYTKKETLKTLIGHRSSCKRLFDRAGNIHMNRHVFSQGSCNQQGHFTVS